MGVKKISNSEYKKLGDRVRNNPQNISDDDYVALQELRMSYKEPLATIFNSIEKVAHKIDPNCVCTYRIKRIESIISKLIRFPKMQVNRAEDIAGCRCIMTSTDNVYQLYNRLLKNKDRLPYEIKGVVHDYIQNPKESGYRSIHLNVALRDGNNQRVEIQLRDLNQHNWATLVEITDLLFNTKLKENGKADNPKLFALHYLLAKDEKQLSPQEKAIIADIIIEYGYIEKIGDVFARNYLDIRKLWNRMKLQHYHFFLISTGQSGIPEFSGYSYFEEAEQAYFEKFINNTENKNIVLTHLKKVEFTKISIAYSNYFLTFNNTLIQILIHLSSATLYSYKHNKILAFSRYYQKFLDIISFWIEKQFLEVNTLNNDKHAKGSIKKYSEWSNSIQQGVYIMNAIFQNMDKQLSFNILQAIPYFIKKNKLNNFKKKLHQRLPRI